MKEKTKTWCGIAENDLEFARQIFQNRQRLYFAVHYCHQAIEKILKAIVQERGEEPKRTHNFKTLCIQARLEIPSEIEAFLIKLAPHYLTTRYPEDLRKLYKQYNEAYVQDILNETEEVFQWFKHQLISNM